ncbi:probable myosin light chain kinase DDB_G0271550 [Schistocerca gregaria]|uniref:probable myosin light chain kinase DDB_G0271550 n=1 Tax=Schistocerca gregaria TaxID=7010 RepID=UPI00211EC0A1|nr:probable myosin light chain kinase DDB_G0271550 [Schistocerca gregaria]
MGCIGSKHRRSVKKVQSKPGGTSGQTKGVNVHQINDPSLKYEGDISKDSSTIGLDQFNRDYKICSEIGRGGFSLVYKVIQIKTGQTFAAKVINKNMLEDDLELLRREISVMRKIDHQNVLKLHEIYEDKHRLYIIMELVEGSELFDRIVEKGYYSEKNARNIIIQILSAVAYLHSIGIVHRDLKPENLLCSGTGDKEIVKIADFGLSKIFSDEEQLRTSCGTPGYVAPEVLMCMPYDKSIDMWGIGIITYILLAGYPPFYAENDSALFEKIMNAEYDFDDECWQDVSELGKDFIKHLLIKDPQKRWTVSMAMNHPWVKLVDSDDKQLKITKRRMSEYNIKRKEERLRQDATNKESDLTIPTKNAQQV